MLQAFKRLFQGQDLTKGNTLRCIIMFAIPLLIGNVAQLLYNTVDSIVIGRYVGDAALAAIEQHTAGKTVRKVIVVKGRIVNVVAN